GGSLALGESYMDGAWDCARLDQFFERIVSAGIETKIRRHPLLITRLLLLRCIKQQTRQHARQLALTHYDLGNDLFRAMLDTRMTYTCGYWKKAETLDDAQQHKLELVCQKLQLAPGMRLLALGCGFGALAKYAAKTRGVEVTGITISKEQYNY